MKLLIIVHILLVSTIRNVWTTVRRICILSLGRLWAALLFGKVHCTSKKKKLKKIDVSMLQGAVGVRCCKV